MSPRPLLWLAVALLSGCVGADPEGIAPSRGALTTVRMDFFHRPLPEIPLPNDVATRFDPTSATGLRINASMVAPTRFEGRFRELVDELDGWGTFQPITIPFSGPLDVGSILAAHRDVSYDLSDDVVYLINIDQRSPEFGRLHHLDLGNGNYPVILEEPERYGKNDPRGWTLSLYFEEEDEDTNGNGRLDGGEDSDADGILDRPNYLPGRHPARDDLAGRADALMTFYDQQAHTLILRPMLPLQERTRYAVVVTRRLKDAAGRPVGSPYPYIHHGSQVQALQRLPDVLPSGMDLDDVAFAFSFTTQSIQTPLKVVRDGLYGHGVQAHLGQNYPPRISGLEKLRDPAFFPNMKNPHLVNVEDALEVLKQLASSLLGQQVGSELYNTTLEAQHSVDYHVTGSFESPQLFPRHDKDGNELGLNDQHWPPDLDRNVAPARSETIYFWLTVPRKEVSARGKGQPTPVVILSHSYLTARFEILLFGAYLARYGMASIIIDHPSHGFELSEIEVALAKEFTRPYGLEPFIDVVINKGRARDQNNDGKVDTGADVGTAYTFHTRDMVRQSVLDHMQLIRILRSFDGKRRWDLDVDGDGQKDLAGDFDGDGEVDIGGQVPIHMAGGSLGGIVSLIMGGIEPNLTSIVPISSGAGLADIGGRSINPGVPEAFVLRVMCPIYTGTLDPDTGAMKLETIVPDLKETAELPIATVSGVGPSDTMVAHNLRSGERGCGIVDPEGRVRASVASNVGDETQLLFYQGHVIVGEDCEVARGATPKLTVETLEQDIFFQGERLARGSKLVALAEGLGSRRVSSDMRRLVAFATFVAEPGDPVSFARHIQQQPLIYEATGEATGVHALILTSVGDMNVPVSAAVTAGRAAGLIDFVRPDPRYGKPANQVLIDTHMAEAVHNLNRFTDPSGQGVHMDVDNLSRGTDYFAEEIPRLDPPLQAGVGRTDPLGGMSAALFAYSDPTGIHAFDMPGDMTDKARQRCMDRCTKSPSDDNEDPCGCGSLASFDIGKFAVNVLGRYLVSEGKALDLDLCNSRDDCPDRPPVPELRDPATLP